MNTNFTSVESAVEFFSSKKIAQGFLVEALHTYTDAEGNPLYWRIRLKNPETDEKIIWPLHCNAERNYLLKEPCFTEKKPLYNLHKLIQNKTAPVWVVEGEFCADKLAELGLLATTSGGSSSAAMSDWLPLKDRDIIIWPDNDEPGLNYAKQVAQKLQTLGCLVKQIDLEKMKLSIKEDCVDWLKAKPSASIKEVESLPFIKIEPNTKAIQNQNHQTRKPSLLLLELIKNIELFHDEHNQAYASFHSKHSLETWPIHSDHFKTWLSRQLWESYKIPVTDSTLQEVASILCGKALYEGKKYNLFTRIAHKNHKIYINLSNDKKQVIEVSKNGWEILNTSPTKFKRTQSMRALPIPRDHNEIELLWKHINIAESDRKLVLAWILDCYIPYTNFPILILTGLHGSAKSTTQEILRKLIDPNSCNLRNAPKQSDDISIAAANNWLVSYNNISKLSQQNQDDLCCLSTGGGFAKRRLFTDAEETVINIKRPCILNGINNPITAHDLISRSVIIELPSIHDTKRKSELELKNDFDEDYPFILGALFNLLSKALERLPTIYLAEKPRMADFALLGYTLEQILEWPKGSFARDYHQNYQESMLSSIESSPIALALIKSLEKVIQFQGTFSELLELLNMPCYKPENASNWPVSPKGLANTLKREAAVLAILGIEINFNPSRSKKGYLVTINKK